MDGNGRWARQRGLSRHQGHRAGTEAAKRVVEAARRRGLGHLTLYAFSRENWSRPETEVRGIFDLLVDFLNRELPLLLRESIRLRILGDVAGLPFAARQTVKAVCAASAKGSAMTLNLALNYSGRDEILAACRELLGRGLPPEAVDHETFSRCLFTRDQPDPDLIIRTSGEQRLSNFLLYQSAYSEFYFTDVLWPDFDEAQFAQALASFNGRRRRYGGLDETPRD